MHYNYGMNPNVDALIQELKSVRRELERRPVFRWAVVTSASPLRIRLEEDTLPLLGTPSTLEGGLKVGDRVRVEVQNGRATIHGRGVGSGGNARAAASGAVTINPTGGTPTSATVTLPVGRFRSAPLVVTTPNSTVVGTTVQGSGVSGRTATSFTAWITRSNNTATGVNWIAVED